MANAAYACLCALLVLRSASSWLAYWRRQVAGYETSGHTPPPSSWFAEGLYYLVCLLVSYIAVGPVKLIQGSLEGENGCFCFKRGPVPAVRGRAVYVGPHQFQTDFAMMRFGAGRHLRLLTAASELTGAVGFFSALGGIISVDSSTRQKRQQATESCVNALSARYFRLDKRSLLLLLALSAVAFTTAAASHNYPGALLAVLAAVLAASFPGSPPGLDIFPEGALLPDNEKLEERWNLGAVRIARHVAARTGEAVQIVPIGIVYKRQSNEAHWSQWIFAKTRSLFYGKRRVYWHQAFQVTPDSLPQPQREQLETERARLLAEFEASRLELFGAVVVRGDAVNVHDLPEDDAAATEELRLRVLALQHEAARH